MKDRPDSNFPAARTVDPAAMKARLARDLPVARTVEPAAEKAGPARNPPAARTVEPVVEKAEPARELPAPRTVEPAAEEARPARDLPAARSAGPTPGRDGHVRRQAAMPGAGRAALQNSKQLHCLVVAVGPDQPAEQWAEPRPLTELPGTGLAQHTAKGVRKVPHFLAVLRSPVNER
jgi:hypothetical protein